MDKDGCSAGSQWDNLVKACIQTDPVDDIRDRTKSRPEGATSEVFRVAEVRLRSTARTPRVDPGIALSPAVWLFVVLATLGSILALALWLIIYRQQRRSSSTPEDSKPEQEHLEKTDARLVIHSLASGGNRHADLLRGADDPSLCPFHLHLEAHSSSQWAEDIGPYRAPAKHAETGKSRGLPSCTPVREHRIPLPATELGGTALVTTKTV